MYLGRLYSPQTSTLTDRLDYDPADLTTHAVIVGMTGSGKTGLGIVLLEEAALEGIPAIIIDLKGDLTNLFLHFPDLAPQDFEPWIDPEQARRAGQSLEEAARIAAETWKRHLEEWNIERQRLLDLQNAVAYRLYTPGSTIAPINLLTSLITPGLRWDEHRDALRERILTNIGALLNLLGEESDPLQSRPHILLSHLFERTWAQGQPINPAELILQIQNPPFERLGALPINTFYPPKERNALALRLNNLLAAPAFEAWREGQPLDIQALLYTPEGRPAHNIFYLAHLGENERMFFLTLLLGALETWMRAQSLRAVLYMDELFGYLPPVSNPPSKAPFLRLLKTARAFGLGLILATQNPSDLDYKALSNAGTWFIGKLQTEQDRARLLEGLSGVTPGLERSDLGEMLSALRSRIFLMHNIHNPPPRLFQVRWAMNFLAGPLTRLQIPKLIQATLPAETSSSIPGSLPTAAPSFSGSGLGPGADAPTPATASPTPYLKTKPSLPAGMAEAFLRETIPLSRLLAKNDALASFEGLFYRPAFLAAAEIHFHEPRYGVDTRLLRAALVPSLRLPFSWDEHLVSSEILDYLTDRPALQAYFDLPMLDQATQIAGLQKDFTSWLLRTSQVRVQANEALRVYAGPDVSPAEFRKACADAARQARDAEWEREKAKIERQIKQLRNKIAREERELQQEQIEYEHRKSEEWGTHAENLFGLLTGRGSTRRLSSSLSKRRLTEQAKARMEESIQAIEQYQREIQALQEKLQHLQESITARWSDLANDITEIFLPARRSDLTLRFFGILWCPYYLIRTSNALLELPAFEA